MRTSASLLVLAACGARTATGPTPIANHAPVPRPEPAAPAVAEDETQCQPDAVVPMVVGGVPGEAQLSICTTGDHSSSDEAREAGFVEVDRDARLTWTAAGKEGETSVLDTWTDGWEWGSSMSVVGSLVAPSGEGVLLIRRGSSGPSPGSTGYSVEVAAYARRGGVWKPIASWSGNSVDVALAKGGHAATIDTCVTAADPDKAPGCGSYSDAEPGPTIDITFDGVQVVEVKQP